MNTKDLKKEVLAQLTNSVSNTLGSKPNNLKLEFPPNIKFGNFAFGCFELAKQFKKNPAEIAKILADEIKPNDVIQEVCATGPYVNFKIFSKILFGNVCSEIISQNNNFGNSRVGEGQRIMVEYLSPNTNKPLHLGHVRNGSIGMAISNILEATGHTVIKANLINDRGVHICKSMLAWEKFSDHKTPKTFGIKGDHFVGKWYVEFDKAYNEEIQELIAQGKDEKEAKKEAPILLEAQNMLKKWEEGDSKIYALWKRMNKWVYDGFAKTYKKLGLEFNVFYYESDTYKLGKDTISTGFKEDIFYQDKKGAFVFDLPIKEFGKNKDKSPRKVTVLRADGTSVYITQDIGTALKKVLEHRLHKSIYVVGSEQKFHFQCLFKILETLGYPWAKNCHHLSYGMVYLPDGKMKSREGKVVDADDLISKMEALAAEEIKKRDTKNELSKKEIEKRASKIALGAIKFYLLRVGPSQDIHFDPKESLSFEGFTGPYCQYSYARAAGILSNVKNMKFDLKNNDFSILGSNEELLLAQKLIQFPDTVNSTTEGFNPSRLAIHIFETAKAFNQFYHKNPVLNTEDDNLKKARLALVKATSIALKKGLNLLGIEVMDKM